MGVTQALTINTIYLMGGSFVLGSLFTLLMLIMLDFIRKAKEIENSK